MIKIHQGINCGTLPAGELLGWIVSSQIYTPNWMWRFMSGIAVLRRWRQKDWEFKVIHSYILNVKASFSHIRPFFHVEFPVCLVMALLRGNSGRMRLQRPLNHRPGCLMKGKNSPLWVRLEEPRGTCLALDPSPQISESTGFSLSHSVHGITIHGVKDRLF